MIQSELVVGSATARLRTSSGRVLPLDVNRWWDPASTSDLAVLSDVAGPVLDVGCGPGRLVLALAARGLPVLGIDTSPAAVDAAQSRGATVLERSVFADLPGGGRWATALLFDGNIGIGGRPRALLERIAGLLASGGTAVVEVGAPGAGTSSDQVVLETDGRPTVRFPWAWVSADQVHLVAEGTGLRTRRCLPVGERWFAWLQREPRLSSMLPLSDNNHDQYPRSAHPAQGVHPGAIHSHPGHSSINTTPGPPATSSLTSSATP